MDTEILIKREQLVKRICARLNNFVDLKHTLSTIIEEIKDLTGFEAVSVRLHKDDDYPYIVHKGFPETFIRQENCLCQHTGSVKKPECLCGNVISGRTNPVNNYYTNKGSFWTNNSTILSPTLVEKEKNTIIRNHCNAAGYESIGLFPIKTREENIGLIQLNDKRTEMFTEDIIEYLEMIGEQIGIAIENALLYEQIKDKNEELENSLKDLSNMQSQLMEAKKMTALADLVSGIAHEIYHPISQSLHLLENIISRTKSVNGTQDLISDEKSIYDMLSNAKGLVKSFRSIAFDQFQESRHLININNFLKDVVRVLEPSIRQKNIEFVIECNQHSEIMGFTGILSQVITLLIQNSYVHGLKNRNKGVISLGCGIVDEETIELTVADNGKGIAPNIRHKLFEPFFTTEKKKHTGLGLHIAKNLIENKLKGELYLDQEYGEGAKFVIRIPA